MLISTDKFRPLASAQATTLGLADVRIIEIPHPLGGATTKQIEHFAKIACDTIVGLFR